MCELCQMQFDWDHDAPAQGNVPCPRCGHFYVDPEQRECCHCFAKPDLNELCERCTVDKAGRSVRPV